MLPFLQPGAPIDPVMLRAAVRVYKPQIDAFTSSGIAPDYVVAAVEQLRGAFERWGNETEAARASASSATAKG